MLLVCVANGMAPRTGRVKDDVGVLCLMVLGLKVQRLNLVMSSLLAQSWGGTEKLNSLEEVSQLSSGGVY